MGLVICINQYTPSEWSRLDRISPRKDEFRSERFESEKKGIQSLYVIRYCACEAPALLDDADEGAVVFLELQCHLAQSVAAVMSERFKSEKKNNGHPIYVCNQILCMMKKQLYFWSYSLQLLRLLLL